jgi:DNA-binding MarR family transcriptional regulator
MSEPVQHVSSVSPGINWFTPHTGILIHEVGTIIRARLDAELAHWGLRTRHYAVMKVLESCGPGRSQRDIGEDAGVDPATMVRTVDELERRGFVARERNPRDRRVWDLVLTDHGRLQVAEADAALSRVEQDVFSPLAPHELEALRSVLVRLIERNVDPT